MSTDLAKRSAARRACQLSGLTGALLLLRERGGSDDDLDVGSELRGQHRRVFHHSIVRERHVIQGGGHQPGNANLLWPLLRQYTLP
jgi:hypothetical protein